MNTFTLTPNSSNAKLGNIPVSMSNSSTCPNSCPLKKNGCYAAQGPINWIWKALDKGKMNRKGESYKFGANWKDFVRSVKDLPRNKFWRHNQVGDLVGANDKINKEALLELVSANQGKQGFTYTHYPVIESEHAEHNKALIKQANENGFTVNLSSNNLAHADKLKALNVAPVITILPSDFKEEKGLTPNGNRFIVCPSQTKGLTCEKCQLCNKQRSVIIAFKAHGTAKAKVNKIA